MARPFDRIIGLDFETKWGRAINLGFSCQTMEEYLRDPRFGAWGLSWAEVMPDGSHHEVWVRRNGLKAFFDSIDWSRTAVVAQNAPFDVAIMFWHYGVHPAFVFDTLSMGRALHGVEAGNSLKTLAERYGLPPKMDGLAPTENILDELPFEVEEQLVPYGKHDTWLCIELLKCMIGQFPLSELKLIDTTVQMYTRPQLVLDKQMLQEALTDEEKTLAEALAKVGRTEGELASNDTFAEVLRMFDVDPPMKPSPSAKGKAEGKMIYAFAKTDALFQQLLNGDNEDVALLCAARLNVKSTQGRTRAQRLLEIAGRGPLPVPLNYWGAGPGRWQAAKGSNINMQNMKRGSRLRKAIMAPPGYVCIVGDLSQIEPRVLAWLSDYEELLDIFRSGVDAYAKFGEIMFGVLGMTKENNPVLRQAAKSAMLGCFAADTRVLTERGWVTLTDVTLSDRVWDGVEWVSHTGVVAQGEQHVVEFAGVTATADHEILVGEEWKTWQEVVKQSNYFQQALSSASLPASAGKSGITAEKEAADHVCVAPVAGKGSCRAAASTATAPHSNAERVRMPAHDRQLSTGQQSRSLFQSARLLANSPVSRGGETTERSTPLCAAAVAGKGSWRAATSPQEGRRAAIAAPNARPSKRAGSKRGITPFAQTARTAIGCLRASAPSSSAALTQIAKRIQTTAGAASRSIRRGLQTAQSFCATSLGSLAGTNLRFSSTVGTTIADMCPAISASSPAARIWQTSARSQPAKSSSCGNASAISKQKIPVFDISNAGPRNRFTILSDSGPLIVHNCGYQLGWRSFAAQLLVGFLGAPPKRYDLADAKAMGITAAKVQKFLGNDWHMKQVHTIAYTCTFDELLIHCIVAKEIIERYRSTAAKVVKFWNFLGEMIERCLLGGETVTYKCLTFMKEAIVLPNGMKILYPGLEAVRDERGRIEYQYKIGKKVEKLYPGRVCNNVTQALARIVMSDGMLRVRTRLPVVLTVHDELAALARLQDKEQALPWVLRQMTKEPAYMPGIPLAADGGAHVRYGEAKQ